MLTGFPFSEEIPLRISTASASSGVRRKSPSLVGLAVMCSTSDEYSLSNASTAWYAEGKASPHAFMMNFVTLSPGCRPVGGRVLSPRVRPGCSGVFVGDGSISETGDIFGEAVCPAANILGLGVAMYSLITSTELQSKKSTSPSSSASAVGCAPSQPSPQRPSPQQPFPPRFPAKPPSWVTPCGVAASPRSGATSSSALGPAS